MKPVNVGRSITALAGLRVGYFRSSHCEAMEELLDGARVAGA
jgi:hypothetical protein